MGVKAHPNIPDTSRTEVGEIDTRAPFASVKAAVSLFGEGAFTPYKPTVKKSKPQSSERTSAKETELHVAQKELNKLKDQLKNCETTRIQALQELEKAKRTVDDLTEKLIQLNESRESAVNVTETAKVQIKQLEDLTSSSNAENGGPWKDELENAREHYAVAITELDTAKQELLRIRKDFEASMDAKVSALEQEAQAKNLANTNIERNTQLSKDIADVKESLVHVNSASVQAKQEESKIISDKDASRQLHKLALQEAEKKLVALKKEFDPEVAVSLEAKLMETTAQIGAFQKEIENTRASDMNSVMTVTSELDGAKGVLQKVVEEESSLRKLLESLKLELEKVKREHVELKEKEAETEALAADLNIKLQKTKSDFEAATAGESKARAACDDLLSTLLQLSLESEKAREDADVMRRNAEELRKEAEVTRMTLNEAELKLHVALRDAEEAKAAEVDAINQIKVLSEKANAARSSTSESGAKITISAEEFESLSRKVKESETLAEMKVAAAVAQVEAVKASEHEAVKKLDASRKEIEETEISTKEAVKRAEMAEAARRAVEGEMKRWREREQKKTAEAASRILAEAEMAKESLPARVEVLKSTPPKAGVSKSTAIKTEPNRKILEKTPTSKKTLMPSFSGIFHKKKNHVEGGSPSYLPGEKPV